MCSCSHHQLNEHRLHLLRGGHGQGGLQHSHRIDIIMAVGDRWLVTFFEAAGKYGGLATPLELHLLRCHGYSRNQKMAGNEKWLIITCY